MVTICIVTYNQEQWIRQTLDSILAQQTDYLFEVMKINGFRIELSEIEFHARQFLGDTLVLVLAYMNEEGTQSLAMFVESANQNIDDLKNYLSSKMPSYMIPSQYICVDKFPVNNSSKIDRSALRKLIK